MLDKLSLIALEDVFDMINSFFCVPFWQNRVKILSVNGRTVYATAGAVCPESGHSDYGSVIYGLPYGHCTSALSDRQKREKQSFMNHFNLLKTCFLPHFHFQR